MNRTYRLVWSDAAGAWVAVAERVRGRGKRGRAALLAPALLAAGLHLPAQAAPPAAQLPTGAQVAAGSITVKSGSSVDGARLDINQTSPRGIIDWQGFDVGARAHVHFDQPSADAVTLNRVQGSQPSQIFGRVTAKGQVFLSNPNGVYFSPSASVEVGGLTATTHAISNADFMAGKTTFSRDGATASVVNEGELTAANIGGYIALLAPHVRNSGVIVARAGTVALAAGDLIELQFDGKNTLAGLRVAPSTVAALVDNRLAVQAPGGRIILSAQAADQLQGGVVQHSGSLSASSLVSDGGVIRLVGDNVQLDAGSSVAATGAGRGGEITVEARRVLQSGKLDASGGAGSGGAIRVAASDQVLQTTLASTRADGTGSAVGGNIHLQAGHTLYSSGSVSAQGREGGTIHALGDKVALAAASLDASGSHGGGTVLVGGGFQGRNPQVANASSVEVNPATQIRADAGEAGDGGTAVVWADRHTVFYGAISARGGAQAGHGGQLEVSGKEELVYGGAADAGAPHGQAGSLLLDPANLVVSDAGSLPAYSFIDPNATVNGGFGNHIVPLASGNVVVTAHRDTIGGVAEAGAIYLYDGLTGGLVSALTGSGTKDWVGLQGVTVLADGNYVVRSANWGSNGGPTGRGAVTWGSSATGVSGPVSSANSLVGGTNGDQVGAGASGVVPGGITVLPDGNYVVRSPNWNNGAVTWAGAVTWGNGATGTSGEVSSANSLVGSKQGDQVGGAGVTVLTNGNYVVNSPNWDNGAIMDAGSVTWGSGVTGVSGLVSAANSLVGSTQSDQVGYGGVTALTNGNYVVASSSWGNHAGAATWGSGATGISGVVSAANSLVGSVGDMIGASGVTALTNGNYVVSSYAWSGDGAIWRGAATWGDGTTGIRGEVSIANSLVGGQFKDYVGSGSVTALPNGNYVVNSFEWDNGGFANAGAVTWGNGATGTVGVVSAANSLVGSRAGDQVGGGGIKVLANGNYVVNSYGWNNGAASQVGAVTWGSGTAGVFGAVSSANSLVGSSAADNVGYSGVFALTNGNYVVASRFWDHGGISDAGAATWGDGASGISGVVSAANSLVGSAMGDQVGSNGVTALTNGNYVVRSPLWNNGFAASVAGAATWGDGATGVTGVVSTANSLVGSTANDQVGFSGVVPLANGHYVVGSSGWDNGALVDAGAATWGNGATGTSGVVSAANSLVGSTANDAIGNVTVLSNGNYVVRSPSWNNGAVAKAGAVTWAHGATGIVGTVSSANSLVGSTANDQLGNADVTALGNGDYLVSSSLWDHGGLVDAGAVTWGSGGTGMAGGITPANSLVGTVANQRLGGNAPVIDAVNGTFVVGGFPGLTVQAGFVDPNQVTAQRGGGSTFTITPGFITRTLNGGTAVTMQASQDITVDSAILASGGGALTLQAGGNLLVNAPISTVGALTLQGASDVTLNAPVGSAAVGDSVVLSAGGRFINNAGSAAIDPGAGRYLVYSADPTADTRGGLGYGFKQYGAVLGDAVLGSGSGFLYALAPTITVGLTGRADKVYDGTLAATLVAANFTASGAIAGDALTLTLAISGASYDSKDAGTGKTVEVHGLSLASVTDGTATVYGYRLADTTVSAAIGTITPRVLNVTAIGVDRVYDGTTAATVTFADDRIAGDALTLSGTAAFADKNVGSAKAINVTGIDVAGADAGNYSFGTTATTSADITPRALDITAIGIDRVYDGTTAAMVTLADDRIAGDALTLSGAAAFVDKNVGSTKAIQVTGIDVAGADAGNYRFGTTATASADITPRALGITATGIGRVYDGTTTASVTLADDRIAGDVLALSAGTANFSDKNVGSARPIEVTGIRISGDDAGNYSFSTTTTASADITPRVLGVTATGTDRVYDGTTDAAVTFADDRVAGDRLTLTGTAAFADKNVGRGKPIRVIDISVGGDDARNYRVGTTASAGADITPRALTITATGIDRVYDGTTQAAVTFADDRLAGDALMLSGTAAFADPDVGAAKPVSVTGITLAGADAGNYATAGTAMATTAHIIAAIAPFQADAGAAAAQGQQAGKPPAPALLDSQAASALPAAAEWTVQERDEPKAGDPSAVERAVQEAPAVDEPAASVSASPAANPTPIAPPRPQADAELLGAAVWSAGRHDGPLVSNLGWALVDRLAAPALPGPGRETIGAWLEAAAEPLSALLATATEDAARALRAGGEHVLGGSLAQVWRELDALKERVDIRQAQQDRLMLTMGGGAFALSAGYMMWLLLGGTLASLTVAVMPLWTGFDPLPMLDRKRKPGDDKDDDVSAEDLAAEERIRALMDRPGTGYRS